MEAGHEWSWKMQGPIMCKTSCESSVCSASCIEKRRRTCVAKMCVNVLTFISMV